MEHSSQYDSYVELKKFPKCELWRYFLPQYNLKISERLLLSNLQEKSKGGHIVRKSYLERMMFAFNTILEKTDDVLSISFLHQLHRLVFTKIVFHSQYNPQLPIAQPIGQFRILEEEIFTLTPENSSAEGIKELIWKAKNSKQIRFDIKIQHAKESFSSNAPSLLAYSPAYIMNIISDNNKKESVTFHSHGKTDMIHRLVQSYIDKYQLAAPKNVSQNEKLNSIVEFIQECEQLHPYADGNTRLFSVLILNFLLMKAKFPPAILDYPHAFKGQSKKELVIQVQNGIHRTLAYIANDNTQLELPTSKKFLTEHQVKDVYDEIVKKNLTLLF